MQLIAHQELTSAAASITFSSIPQTFTDLYLVLSARNDLAGSGGDSFASIRFNATGTNSRLLRGQGAAIFTNAYTGNAWFHINASTDTANTFSSVQIYVPNYSRTDVNKSFSLDGSAENNATSATNLIFAGLYPSNTAISSITFTSQNASLANAGNFVSGSSATLYGILAGSSGGVVVS
jgi:hypothetical protein